ncbi:MAG: CoA-binding protein [Alphaproteobacteria bacterium]|nr:CoA-binding protein [Alphaproteobacteria bacterium]
MMRNAMILPTSRTPVLIQGISSEKGAMHTEMALAFDTRVVAGTSRAPGMKHFLGVPVFKSVAEAVAKTKPKVSVIFAPPDRVLAEAKEAARAKIPLIVCTTEHVPAQTALRLRQVARDCGVTILGPAAPGLVVPDVGVFGTMPTHLFQAGRVGVIGRSGSLIYEAVGQLKKRGLGVSACVAVGTAPVLASSYRPAFEALLRDDRTRVILVIGLPQGPFEFELADIYQKTLDKKPLCVYIPGTGNIPPPPMTLIGEPTEAGESVRERKIQALVRAGAVVVAGLDTIGKEVAHAAQ